MTAPQLGLFGPAPMLRDRKPLVSVPAAGVIQPRDYQLRADAAIDEALAKHRSTLVTMATGTGKTVLFAMQARKRGNALVIAHETSLIEQAAQKLRHVTGEYVAIEKAERRDRANAKYVVASMQTLRGDRLRFFAETHAHIDLIVIDEAHRALAKSYRDIIAAFPHAKVLGVTATADRGDKKAMGLVFDSVAFRYDIVDATADGWLTPFDWFPMDVTGVNLDDVGLKGGDLDQDQLDEQLVSQAGQMAQAVVQHCKGLRTVAFCPGVKSATLAAEAVNRIEPGTARAIYGDLPDHEKAAIKAAHARGEFLRLFNCAILIEGYDDPRLEAIVDFAKTKSRARFAQKLGRGSRLWPVGIDHLGTPEERRAAIAASPKPTCKFFDANYGQHGHTLAGPIDLLGGRYDDETKERAKKKLDETGGSVEGALELAAAELAEENRRKLARLAAKAAKAKGQVLVGPARAACELFGVATDMGVDDEPRGEPREHVVAWLETKGVKNAGSMPEGAARKLKKTLKERANAGLATFKMVKALKKAGHPRAETLKFEEAGRLMGILTSHHYGWKFPPEMFQGGDQ
jgi:superfamily II DNA or RNA helicase